MQISNIQSEREAHSLSSLMNEANIDPLVRKRIQDQAEDIVTYIRSQCAPSMMELFLGEYGLSSEEGVALMCLAEALLRVPDSETMDALIADKILPSSWGEHLGKSHSSLVNASTWALMIAGKVLDKNDGSSVAEVMQGAVRRVGEPIIRQAVTRAMKEMGRQFVLGETIERAVTRAKNKEAKGFTYSYDMLGEAARTDAEAERYLLDYSNAIKHLTLHAKSDNIRENPGISIKLSALHARYETLQKERVMAELVPRAHQLMMLAKAGGIGLNIDAEEAGRLDLSLDVIETLARDLSFAGWDGLGVVVQAYGLKAPEVLDRLYDLAKQLDRKFMVRLVKGAYWDTEIKLAQVEGHDHFPVFTRKPSTDVSYICCAKKLFNMADRIYPQFATHNAHTAAAIFELAPENANFEFQRLHGMGEALHDGLMQRHKTKCRIYAPVGAHKDLLAYLARRLLENGANSSFVNQIVDESIAVEEVTADPFAEVGEYMDMPLNPVIQSPCDIFQPERVNSKGWDLMDPQTIVELEKGIAQFDEKQWSAGTGRGQILDVQDPSTGENIGKVRFSNEADIASAFAAIRSWDDVDASDRASILNRAADLYEGNAHEIFALLMREAGKSLADCIGELREAVDFLRYYAAQSVLLTAQPVGVFTCISPWNFPLAIFTGQMSAALAAGNGVVAKPAESTNLIADFAVSLLWQAGVPKDVLTVLFGTGREIGGLICSDKTVDGVCFTGSTQTAQIINQTMAKNLAANAPLIAETGGLNAMIVDSSALPQQAVADIVASAFQSAGQRCSALRVLYIQKEIEDVVLKMLFGAMDELKVGNPRDFATDVGPIINNDAAKPIQEYVKEFSDKGRVLKQCNAPAYPNFVAPTVLRVDGIEDVEKEIFGPILHIATFEADEIDDVIDAVNAKGFGLTFGFHSRIDDRVQQVVERVKAGNIYINRNQIGAVVGSQPFGGEGLSGTGPKAGGPRYLKRFIKEPANLKPNQTGGNISVTMINDAFSDMDAITLPYSAPVELPGPTGESNQYSTVPRGYVLCLGPTAEMATLQQEQARSVGCNAIAIAPGVTDGIDGVVSPQSLTDIANLDAVVCWADDAIQMRIHLSKRTGEIVSLLMSTEFSTWLETERHVCINTTAVGGNTDLLGAA